MTALERGPLPHVEHGVGNRRPHQDRQLVGSDHREVSSLKGTRGSKPRTGSAPRSTAAVVAVPQLEILARVAFDVLQLVGAHLANGLGGDAHHQPSGRHDLPGRHERARADLGTLLDDRAREHDGADADAHVVHDRARVDHGAMADGHAGAHDAGELGSDVQDRAVLRVGIPAELDVVVLVAPQDRERPHAGALLDDDVPDHLGRRIDVRVGGDAGSAAGDLPDHRVLARARGPGGASAAGRILADPDEKLAKVWSDPRGAR